MSALKGALAQAEKTWTDSASGPLQWPTILGYPVVLQEVTAKGTFDFVNLHGSKHRPLLYPFILPPSHLSVPLLSPASSGLYLHLRHIRPGRPHINPLRGSSVHLHLKKMKNLCL